MATIFRSFASIITNNDFNNMQPRINTYWNGASRERTFPIPFWRLNQLFTLSTSEEVAFKVTDLRNPSLVNGEWVTFEDGSDEVLGEPNIQSGVTYFILNEDQFEEIRTAVGNTPVQELAILGRIGETREEQQNEEGESVIVSTFFAFLYPARCQPIPPGGSGGGASSGITLPPGEGGE